MRKKNENNLGSNKTWNSNRRNIPGILNYVAMKDDTDNDKN